MFHILERYVWEGNWSSETVSFLARHLVLARHGCSSTSFVGSSDHLLSFRVETVGADVMLVWFGIQTKMTLYSFMLGTR